MRDTPDSRSYAALSKTLDDFVPRWPIHGSYFPLAECGLTLEDIAYTNVVRCRTRGNRAPAPRLAQNCINKHFVRWLDVLRPRVVVFLGKWASDHAALLVAQRGVPHTFLNRQRSLSSAARTENRQDVVALVKGADSFAPVESHSPMSDISATVRGGGSVRARTDNSGRYRLGREPNLTASHNAVSWNLVSAALRANGGAEYEDLIAAVRQHDHPAGGKAFIDYCIRNGWLQRA